MKKIVGIRINFCVSKHINAITPPFHFGKTNPQQTLYNL